MKRLLVTAPHSFCVPYKYRHCDTVALNAVNHIKDYNTNHDVKYHVSDRLRQDGDYNRSITDAEQWRKDLRNLAQSHKPDFVLEIHSYPGWHPMYKKKWGNAELVVFESSHNAPFLDKLIERILYHANWSIKVRKGYPLHDVALTKDLAPLYNHALFEFNETDTDRNNKKIAQAILDAAVDISNWKSGKTLDTKKYYIKHIVKIMCIALLVIVIMIIIYITNRLIVNLLSYTYVKHDNDIYPMRV
jgi:hypothetical protein